MNNVDINDKDISEDMIDGMINENINEHVYDNDDSIDNQLLEIDIPSGEYEEEQELQLRKCIVSRLLSINKAAVENDKRRIELILSSNHLCLKGKMNIITDPHTLSNSRISYKIIDILESDSHNKNSLRYISIAIGICVLICGIRMMISYK